MTRAETARRRVQANAARLALQASRRAESRYVRDLRAILRGAHTSFLAYLVPRLADVAGRAPRRDAFGKHSIDLGGLETHILKQLPAKVRPAFDRMSSEVNAANKVAAKRIGLLGIPHDAQIAVAIAAKRDENIALVVNAGRVYAQDVKDIFEDPDNIGRTVEDLTDLLLERGNVSESRAELIARDQTLKLNGQVNELRQTAAGVDSYTWSTSHDERVRESHAELDGETFTWASGGPPDIGHPGEDFQCRCIGIPIIDFGPDTGEDDTP